ncbi:hypothetical protein BS17DRAFT_649872, partial [Gyrodon lividus]
CPHHTFLALFILELEFMQDNCYMNWEWAKLISLSPHEISQCKPMLGEALDWHLWV